MKQLILILSLFLSNLCFSAEAELNKKNLALVFGQFKYFNSERNLLIARMLVEPASLQEAIEKDSRRYEGLKKITIQTGNPSFDFYLKPETEVLELRKELAKKLGRQDHKTCLLFQGDKYLFDGTVGDLDDNEIIWFRHYDKVDLSHQDLRGCDFKGKLLVEANLEGADLRRANLRGAYLTDAYLWGADLSGADLMRADLRDANLSGANLRGANLRGADLRRANLTRANLWWIKHRRTNFTGAIMTRSVGFKPLKK